MGYYWRLGRWRRVVDHDLHVWEAHGEVLGWWRAEEVDGKAGERKTGNGVWREVEGELVGLVREAEHWTRMADSRYRPPRDTTRAKAGERGDAGPEARASPSAQGLYFPWDDLEVAGCSVESGASPFVEVGRDENKARAEPRPSSGTEMAGPEKKTPFWERAKTRTKGKRVKILKELKKRFALAKATLGTLSPWWPFRAYGWD